MLWCTCKKAASLGPSSFARQKKLDTQQYHQIVYSSRQFTKHSLHWDTRNHLTLLTFYGATGFRLNKSKLNFINHNLSQVLSSRDLSQTQDFFFITRSHPDHHVPCDDCFPFPSDRETGAVNFLFISDQVTTWVKTTDTTLFEGPTISKCLLVTWTRRFGLWFLRGLWKTCTMQLNTKWHRPPLLVLTVGSGEKVSSASWQCFHWDRLSLSHESTCTCICSLFACPCGYLLSHLMIKGSPFYSYLVAVLPHFSPINQTVRSYKCTSVVGESPPII